MASRHLGAQARGCAWRIKTTSMLLWQARDEWWMVVGRYAGQQLMNTHAVHPMCREALGTTQESQRQFTQTLKSQKTSWLGLWAQR
eukprot:8046544-Alexandrium_andersonii.AAC.1